MRVHLSSTISRAPFVKATSCSSISCNVLIIFLSDVKITSCNLGSSSSSFCFHIPALAAATSKAISVGSPIPFHSLLDSSSAALLHKAAALSSISKPLLFSISTGVPSISNSPMGPYPIPVTSSSLPGSTIFLTVISLRVRVPVLSVQMTVVEPSVSTPSIFLTIALC
ncbi:MAG: hypothetical protein A4E23_00112 [Methanomethylovorans sp. PtaU1.Bin073]|nr:MAG: hypothetical protein A4E23_00112 [Methanomethylovorans sp. PtaU1.Bin073]